MVLDVQWNCTIWFHFQITPKMNSHNFRPKYSSPSSSGLNKSCRRCRYTCCKNRFGLFSSSWPCRNTTCTGEVSFSHLRLADKTATGWERLAENCRCRSAKVASAIARKPNTHVSPSSTDMMTAFCNLMDRTAILFFIADPPVPDLSRRRMIRANTTRLWSNIRPTWSSNP